MNIRFFFSLWLFLIMFSCKTQNAKSSDSGNPILTIEQGKSAKIPNSSISLSFNNIEEDSRCPEGMTCVWEGIAILNMEAKSADETKSFQIATKDFASKNALKSFKYKGYKLTLQNLTAPNGTETATIRYEKE